MDKSSPQTKINPFEIGDLRNYFRVRSQVKLRTASVTAQQIKNGDWPNSLSKSPAMQLCESLRHVEQEAQATLRAIGEKNRNIEQYFRSINKRLDLIANYLSDTDEKNQQRSEQRVLISEGGLEFSTDNLSEVKLGDCFAIELILSLSHTSITTYGKVINIRENGRSYLIGTEFIEMKDADRQQLAKHVIQQQLQDKRDAKDG